jgi:hypothetical protein
MQIAPRAVRQRISPTLKEPDLETNHHSRRALALAPRSAVLAPPLTPKARQPSVSRQRHVVTLGGYVKLDAILSDKSAGVDSVGDQMLNPNLIRWARMPGRTRRTR